MAKILAGKFRVDHNTWMAIARYNREDMVWPVISNWPFEANPWMMTIMGNSPWR